MTDPQLTMARRHVLGDLYSRCEPAQNVPVYLNEPSGELLGYVDECQGKYADAMTFHIAEDLCKKLAAGHFGYSFEYDFAGDSDVKIPSGRRRIRLSSILLIKRKGYEKPVPRSAASVTSDQAETVV